MTASRVTGTQYKAGSYRRLVQVSADTAAGEFLGWEAQVAGGAVVMPDVCGGGGRVQMSFYSDPAALYRVTVTGSPTIVHWLETDG